jgi:enoyl-CoA hydratase/carnithine racemase
MTHSPLALEWDGDVALLVLDAPPRNVMDRAFFHAFAACARDVLPGLDAAGLVVRARGRHFSAGADVDQLREVAASGDADACRSLRENAAAFTALEALPFPTVAAVDGACLGSGLELALACGGRVATPSALFAAPEASFDLMPGCGGTVRLPERVGVGAALDLLLTGRYVDAQEALHLGLVDVLAPRAELHGAAVRWVRRLAAERGRSA